MVENGGQTGCGLTQRVVEFGLFYHCSECAVSIDRVFVEERRLDASEVKEEV